MKVTSATNPEYVFLIRIDSVSESIKAADNRLFYWAIDIMIHAFTFRALSNSTR